MKIQRLRLATFVLSLMTLIALCPSTSSAATKKPAAPPVNSATNQLRLSPVRTDVVIKAGVSQQVEVTAYNDTSNAVVLQAIENDFIAGDEKGTPSIILDANKYAPTHSLKRFMVKLPNFTVAPHSSTTVKVTITVPGSAQAGGYFGALRFAPATISQSQVSLGASAVSLILLTVPGPTVENLTLTNFDVQQDGGSSSNFRTPDNLNVLIRFQNKGNLQEAPSGLIYVKKGKKVVYTSKFNQIDPKAQVLPDSARRWEVPLKGFGKFGKYTVAATFGYGSNGQSLEVSKTVWIIPTTFIIAVIGGIVGLVVVILVIRSFLKSYKKRILESQRKNSNNNWPRRF